MLVQSCAPVNLAFVLQEVIGFCLAIQPTDDDIGVIGQNYMTGYRMVFDRESLKLGWSSSNCQDLTDNNKRMPPTPPSVSGKPSNPLPTNEEQSTPRGHAVAPAIAGRAPSKPSAAASPSSPFRLVNLLVILHILVMAFRVEQLTN